MFFIDNNSDKNLLILGDSSVISINQNIIQNNQLSSYNIYFVSIVGTEFFKLFDFDQNCKNCWLNWIKNNPSTIIFSIEMHNFLEVGGYYNTIYYEESNSEIFQANMRKLSSFTKELYILEPFPTTSYTSDFRNFINVDSKNIINEIYVPFKHWKENTKITTELLEKLESSSDLQVIQTKDLFCRRQENKCFIYNNNKLFYYDPAHLSLTGSSLIINQIKLVLDK